MKTVVFSKEMARQFALDIFDQLILDIKKKQEETQTPKDSSDEQQQMKGEAA